MLAGSFYHNMDEKGRIVVPSKIREELGDNFYLCLSISNKNELEGFTAEAYGELAEEYASHYSDNPTVVSWFFQYSFPVTIDKQGRTMIPAVLREKAELGENLMTIGIFNKIIIKNSDSTPEVSLNECADFRRRMDNEVRAKKAKQSNN